MDLMEVLDQVQELLQRKGRITYRMLKAQFRLDDEAIVALREELIEGEGVAVDEDSKVLVWTGNAEEDKGKRITDKGGNVERRRETAKWRNGLRAPDSKLRTFPRKLHASPSLFSMAW